MKKNWLYLFALICSVALFTACSDDETPTLPVTDINATYTSTDATNVLELTYAGVVTTGKSVTFNSADGQTATITMTGAPNDLLGSLTGVTVNNAGVIPGESSTTLNVTLVPVGETGYTFSGTDDSNGRTVEYSGAIEQGKLTLDVTANFDNNLIGTWNLVPVPSSEDPSATLYPIQVVWESDTDLSLLGGLITMPLGDVLNLALRMPIIDGSLSANNALTSVLQGVTFGADGNIIASYSDAANLTSPVWQDSPAGMVQYCVKNGKLYAYLDVEAIMGLVTAIETKADSGSSDLLSSILPIVLTHIGEITPLLSEGIPLGYDIDAETGVLNVYIEKEGLGDIIINIATEMLSDENIVAALTELMASDPSFGSMASMLDLTQLPDVLNGTTNMEVGLNFNPTASE
jgi:hypothetical protein